MLVWNKIHKKINKSLINYKALVCLLFNQKIKPLQKIVTHSKITIELARESFKNFLLLEELHKYNYLEFNYIV